MTMILRWSINRTIYTGRPTPWRPSNRVCQSPVRFAISKLFVYSSISIFSSTLLAFPNQCTVVLAAPVAFVALPVALQLTPFFLTDTLLPAIEVDDTLPSSPPFVSKKNQITNHSVPTTRHRFKFHSGLLSNDRR